MNHNTKLRVRKAGPADIHSIVRIAEATWPVAYGKILSKEQLHYMLTRFYAPDSLKEQMTTKEHQFIIAENTDSVPVGFASYAKIDAEIWHLHKLYILPDAQGKNAGRELIGFIVQHIENMGAKALRLNVNRQNSAIGFYEKAGFQIIGTEDIDIGNDFFMNDFVMELRLI